MDPPFAERFWSKSIPEPTTGCWLWLAAADPDGYGLFKFRGHPTRRAHRVAYELSRGRAIPKHFWVCHHCDQPACVNPVHLYLGTHKSNSEDMVRRGRTLTGDSNPSRTRPECLPRGDASWPSQHPELMARGSRHWARKYPERVKRGEKVNTSKLTAEEVVKIRAMFGTGEYDRAQLARMYGLSWTAMNRLVRGLHWKHV